MDSGVGVARNRSHLALIACTLFPTASACSQADPSRQANELNEARREFSAAEKAAARSLSVLAVNDAANANDDPFERAVRCHAALGGLRAEFGSSEVLGEAQLAELVSAERYFEQRVQEEGAAAGRRRAQIGVAIREAEQQRPGIADELRIALNCVRQTQS